MFDSLLLVFTLHNVIEFSGPRRVSIQTQSSVSENLEQVSHKKASDIANLKREREIASRRIVLD